MLRSVIATIRDSLFPPDPGALRFRAAFQATLSGFLPFGATILLGELTPIPVADRILGFVIGLFTSVAVRDGSKVQQAKTMALVPLVASTATAVATLLLEQDLIAAALMPCIVFGVIYGGTHGARWSALGVIGLMSYTIGLVTRLPLDTLPARILTICLGVSGAGLVRFILLPDNPQSELDRLRREIERCLEQLLVSVEAALTAGAWTRSRRWELQYQQNRLRMTVLFAEARIWAMPQVRPGLGLYLLETELAAEGVTRAALHNLGTPDERSRLQADIAALRSRLDGSSSPTALVDHRSPLGRALTDLGKALGKPLSTGSDPQPPPPLVTSGIRPAVQGVTATALAIVAGEIVSAQRWYWAAFAAFAMFQGTRSRGESLAKELQFLIGTIAGVFAGVLFSTVLHGHELLSMAAIVVAVFLAWQASLAAYAVMIFWITVILGLVFGLLGYFSPEVLLLRLKESVTGAFCGILVAFVVMARPTRDFVDATIAAFLGALAQAVGAAASLLLGQPADRRLPSALVEMESRLVDVRAAAATAPQGLGIARHTALRRRLLLLEACATWVINFSQVSLDGLHLTEPTIVAAVQDLVHQIEWRVARLTDREADAPPANVDCGMQADSDSNVSDIVGPLRLINLALTRMAETMTARNSRPVAN